MLQDKNGKSKMGKSLEHELLTTHSSGAPEFIPCFQLCSCYSSLSFLCTVLLIVVCLFVPFRLAIVLSVFQITASDYLFRVLKPFEIHSQNGKSKMGKSKLSHLS
jgi:hypothetical protein